jgi:hypothetical protein
VLRPVNGPGWSGKLGFGALTFFRPKHHDACMRTTLTLDPDVAAKAKRGAATLGQPFKTVINSALRIGLDEVLKPAKATPYRMKPLSLGLKPGFSYDNIGELLAQIEGEDSTVSDFARFRGLKWKNPIA